MSTGKVLVAGGQNGSALGSAEEYEPATRTWSATATPMGGARSVHVAVALEGKVLVVGGVGATGSSQKTAEVYAYAYDACAGVVCNSGSGTCYESATCSNGVCSYVPKASGAACDDGNACTGADACNGAGVCVGTATSCSGPPPGQCYEAAGACSGGSCSYAYKAAGAACDDKDACTVGEECNGVGGCAGTPVSCNSPPNTKCYQAAGTCSNGACKYVEKAGGTECGAGQVCNATGQCLSGCWIGGAYYAAGTTNPSVACQECNPGVSTSGWSNKAVGTVCGAPAKGAWGSCGGFSDTCDETGSQSRTVTAYACTSGGTCAGSDSSETQACTRPAPATSCAAPSYGAWSACSGGGNVCSTTGTQSRTVTSSSYSCASGQCVASTSTETQSCVLTPPNPCAPNSYGAWGGCGGFSDYCDTTGTESRSVTTYACGSGACNGSTSTETQACTRTAGPQTCAAPSYGAWSACSGGGNVCSTTGTQSRTVTSSSYSCASGTCVASTSTETQSCALTPPNPCAPTSYGAWGSCGGFSDYCDTTGTQARSMTTYSCGGGACNGSPGSETQACTRTAPGPQACSATYGSWGPCGGFSDVCDTTGTQSRQVTHSTYSCSTGGCVATSTSTETQTCTRFTDGTSCGSSVGGWGVCGGFSDYCDATGTQSRSVTALSCGGGTCSMSNTSTGTQDCTRTAPGPQACSATYGGWGPCGGFSDVCDMTGTRSRPVTYSTYSCSTGGCVATSSGSESETCTRITDGTSCGSSVEGVGVCGGFSDYCDATGTQSKSVTSYTCGSGRCNGSTSTSPQVCTRTAPGPQPCQAPTYGQWSACSGSGACARQGTQRRDVTSYSYSCGSGTCVGSPSVETQACTLQPDYYGCSCAPGYSTDSYLGECQDVGISCGGMQGRIVYVRCSNGADSYTLSGGTVDCSC